MFSKRSLEDECVSLHSQLKEAYEKCSTIYETLIFIDDQYAKERNLLEELIQDLRRTIQYESEQSQLLAKAKLQLENNEKSLQNELNLTAHHLKHTENQYRKLYLIEQQEKFIRENLITHRHRHRRK